MKSMFLMLAIVLLGITGLRAQTVSLRQKEFNLDQGAALSGYDPVAYFTEYKPVKGSKEHTVVYQGVVYYFSTAVNKQLFTSNPEKYEPAYGGWCAYAMGTKGEKVSIDPKTFKIVDGRLNLFYHSFLNNTLTDWNKNEMMLKKRADLNWAKTFH